jgi:hypothetical protein
MSSIMLNWDRSRSVGAREQDRARTLKKKEEAIQRPKSSISLSNGHSRSSHGMGTRMQSCMQQAEAELDASC